MSLGANQLRQLSPVLIAVDPTVNDDITKGFIVGSVVWSIASSAFFYCTDATAGTAAWSAQPSGGTAIPVGTAAGTNTYTVTMTPTVTSYVAGQIYEVRFTNGNTASSTIDMDGVGAVTIRKDGANLSSGDILPGQYILLIYDGTFFQANGCTDRVGVPAGSDTEVQFNDGGNFGADSTFTFNKTTDVLTAKTLNSSDLTASQLVVTDASKNLASLSILTMTLGGSGKNLTPSNGGIVWTDADSMEILAAAAGAGQPLLSGGAGTPTWGTAPSGVVDYSGSDSIVGFSAFTTHIFLYSYNPQTKMCVCVVSFAGTSDATSITTSLPFTSAAQNQTFAAGGVTNNGVTSLDTGRLSIAASGTTAVYTRDRNGTAWTASGNKVWYGVFTYLTA